MIQGLTHFSALKIKLLEAGKVLRLAGETKCPVYPGKSSYVGVLTLQSTVLPFTVLQIQHFSLQRTPALLHTTPPAPNASPLQ